MRAGTRAGPSSSWYPARKCVDSKKNRIFLYMN